MRHACQPSIRRTRDRRKEPHGEEYSSDYRSHARAHVDALRRDFRHPEMLRRDRRCRRSNQRARRHRFPAPRRRPHRLRRHQGIFLATRHSKRAGDALRGRNRQSRLPGHGGGGLPGGIRRAELRIHGRQHPLYMPEYQRAGVRLLGAGARLRVPTPRSGKRQGRRNRKDRCADARVPRP